MRVFTPKTVEEAVALKAANRGAVVLAGGTDLLAQWNAGAEMPESLIIVSNIGEMNFIRETSGKIEIGACASHCDIASDAHVNRYLPALACAASSIGAPAIRNMGTIGGNIANASPAADLPPTLMVYDATVRLVSTHGIREVCADSFFTGYKKIDMNSDEIIFSVAVPIPANGSVSGYYKVGTRKSQSIAKASVAGFLSVRDGKISCARFAAGSVAPVPLRLREVEQIIEGRTLDDKTAEKAASIARQSINPIDDVRSTADYRRFVTGSLVIKFIMDTLDNICQRKF